MANPAGQHYPDQGYLSDSRYVNEYFGFGFQFPAEAGLRPLAEPVAADGRIQLLHLSGPSPAKAEISVVAFPRNPSAKSSDAKAMLRAALDHDLYIGVEELQGLSKKKLGGRQFYLFETRQGIDEHMLLAADLDGYTLEIVLAARNEDVLKQMQAGFEHIEFFPPAQARIQAGADAHEYEGPAISMHRLALLKTDPPASHIDPGQLEGNVYKNQSLGITYRIPDGWTLEPQGAVQPAVERSRRANAAAATPTSAERELMKVCRRMFFSAWAKRPDANGNLSYDDFGEVTISAISTACFPMLDFPESVSDEQGIKNFAAGFALMFPIVRDMRDAKALDVDGSVLLVLHGNVAFNVEGDELSRRLSITMAVAKQDGDLLTWFFAAPHDAELQDLLENRLGFTPAPRMQQASATRPAPTPPEGDTPAPAPTPASATAAHNAPGEGSSSAAEPNAPEAVHDGAVAPRPAEAQPDKPAAEQTPRPTLLRPGETMQDQQSNGKRKH